MLDEPGIRRYFARLRLSVRVVTPVDLHHRLTYAFLAPAVVWPYRFDGWMTVWLDAQTGLPAQFRAVAASGSGRFVAVTDVDSIRTISSTTLPGGFLEPPDRRLTPWDALAARIDRLLGNTFGHG